MHTKDLNNRGHKNEIYDDLKKVKEKARETRDAITKTAYDAKEKAQEFVEQSIYDVKERTADIQEDVIHYVQKNPVKAIGFSVLAGLILSQLLRK
ncbi:MAG: hypothetical protein P4M12_11210 [Gammaproteobacteria bacterium]|nr:hypothetical protein [Gammaproteobacteria bacterium]